MGCHPTLFVRERIPTSVAVERRRQAVGARVSRRVRLITCGGAFDEAGHYRDNIVVFARVQP